MLQRLVTKSRTYKASLTARAYQSQTSLGLESFVPAPLWLYVAHSLKLGLAGLAAVITFDDRLDCYSYSEGHGGVGNTCALPLDGEYGQSPLLRRPNECSVVARGVWRV